MFKTKYAAVCEHIAPTPAMCEQVLAAMHAEEAAHIPTIVPIKKNTSNVRFWMPLVACAAVALIAVTLGLTLREGDPLPVAPVSPTTTTVPTTSTTEGAPSTTVADEVIASTSDSETTTASGTSNVVTSTTPTTKAPVTTTPTTKTPSSTEGATSTAPVLSTAPASATLKSPADYNELLGLMQPFTSATASTSSTYAPPTQTRPGETTALPTTALPLVPPTKGTTTEHELTAPSASKPGATSASPTTTTSPFPTRPQCGAVVTDTNTTPPLQVSDDVVARLERNTVHLAPADKANAFWISSVTPTFSSDMYVADYSLYGDRLALVCRPNTPNAPTSSVQVLVYELKGTTARLVGEYGQDGMYLAAHRVEDVLYIVTYYTPSAIDPSNPATFVPRLYNGETATPLSAQQIAVAGHPVGNAYTVVTALSLSGDDTRLSATAIYGQSNNSLFLFDTDILISSVAYTSESGKRVCDLVNIPLAKTALFPRATITLSGNIALAHATPDLYYVLTTDRNADSTHRVLVLNRQMQIIGQAEGVLDGRFVFTDTALHALNSRYRHTVDLRIPTAPRILERVETNWSVEWIEEIGPDRLFIVYHDQAVNGTPILAIADSDWNVLQQVSTRSGFVLGAPRDGLIVLRDEIFSYDETHGIQKEADVHLGDNYVYPTLSNRTLYFMENDNVVYYDRTNNYRLMGKF